MHDYMETLILAYLVNARQVVLVSPALSQEIILKFFLRVFIFFIKGQLFQLYLNLTV